MIQDDDASDRSADVVIPLMAKFALLCRYGDGSREEKYLVPSVLSHNAKIPEVAAATHRACLEVEGFFPDGLWERLLCRCVDYSAVRGHAAVHPALSAIAAYMSIGDLELRLDLRQDARCVDVRLRGKGEDIAWFCATIYDMAVDVGDQFFRLVEGDVHLWLRDGQGREADLRAVRAAKEAKHDQCPSRSAGMIPVAPMLEMWFDKDPAPAPPAPSTLDGAEPPVVYTRDSWKPFERPGGCTYHVFLAHSSPSFAKTVSDVLGRRGIFSWYEQQTPDWAQRLEACAAVVVLVTGGSRARRGWRRRSAASSASHW